MRWLRLALCSAVVLAAIGAAAGWAGTRPGSLAWGGGTRHGAGAEHWCDPRRLDGALADIRSMLALKPAQYPAWDGFAAAVSEAAPRICAVGRSTSGGGLVELERAELALENGLVALRAVRPAFLTLHETLGEEQRRVLDTLFARRRG